MARLCSGSLVLALWGLLAGPASAARIDRAAPPPRDLQIPWSLEALGSGGVLYELEYGTARSDHLEVAQAVARCKGAFENPVAWSASTRAVLLFELGNTLNHSIQRLPPDEDSKNKPQLHLTYFQKAAVSFSDKLSRDRLASRYALDSSHLWGFWLQSLAVALGALATILIGIRSIVEKENKHIAFIAACAVAASALSTAVTTLNTFGNYQTTELRSARTLAQLQQLHWRVVSDIMKNDLLCSEDHAFRKQKTSQINAWRDRFETITDASVENLARPGDLGTPQDKPEDKAFDEGLDKAFDEELRHEKTLPGSEPSALTRPKAATQTTQQ